MPNIYDDGDSAGVAHIKEVDGWIDLFSLPVFAIARGITGAPYFDKGGNFAVERAVVAAVSGGSTDCWGTFIHKSSH